MVQDTNQNEPSTASSAAAPLDEIQLQDEQFKMIQDETKQNPLVGEKVSFFTVVATYDPVDSPEYFKKANELAEQYSHVRQIRGDGNCYYRAIFAGLTEIFLDDKEKLAKFIETSKEWMQKIVDLGFPDWTCTDFCEHYIDFLQKIHDGQKTREEVFENMNDDQAANYLLMFFRLITSAYLKANKDEYSLFMEEGETLEKYCETEIEGMWKDAEGLALIAAAKACNINVRIEYMSRAENPNGSFHYDIDGSADAVTNMILLYRPGHYDLIYKRNEEEKTEEEK